MSHKEVKGSNTKHKSTAQKDVFEPLFGAPIEDAARRSDSKNGAVPLPILRSVAYLNERGLTEEGLYRVPGNVQIFAEYRQQFDKGVDVDFLKLDERSPENVAMVIIKYLQMLPDPLLTKKWEQHFKVALGLEAKDPKERYHVIRAILLRLPYANRETVRVLAEHLKLVAKQSAVVGAVMRVLVETDAPLPSTIIFGTPLSVACRNSEIADSIGPFLVPSPILKAWEWFKRKQCWSSDLFIKDLPSPRLPELKFNFNSGIHSIPDDCLPQEVAGFVKAFVAEMPDSLFSDALHEQFGAVADLRTADEQIGRLRYLFAQLHPTFRHTLKALTLFLLDVVVNSKTMSSFSLALTFDERYVDKLPLLIDNASTLFGSESDVTLLPWVDTTKPGPATSADSFVSFSLTSSMNENTAQESEISQQKLKKKSSKGSKHARDSPTSKKSSSKSSSSDLKRIKSAAELTTSKSSVSHKSPKNQSGIHGSGDGHVSSSASLPELPKKNQKRTKRAEFDDVSSSAVDKPVDVTPADAHGPLAQQAESQVPADAVAETPVRNKKQKLVDKHRKTESAPNSPSKHSASKKSCQHASQEKTTDAATSAKEDHLNESMLVKRQKRRRRASEKHNSHPSSKTEIDVQ